MREDDFPPRPEWYKARVHPKGKVHTFLVGKRRPICGTKSHWETRETDEAVTCLKCLKMAR